VCVIIISSDPKGIQMMKDFLAKEIKTSGGDFQFVYCMLPVEKLNKK
jgi:hypothetical protein